jgi:poly-gamma-glutamate synthesis protein (capsule biosynthesis protein)
VPTVGAGRDVEDAEKPLALPLADGRRLLVFAFAARDSGVPPGWAAGRDRPGVAYLPELSEGTADRVLELAHRARRPGDLVVVSVHWGSNWGYDVPRDQRRFAHRLVDGGVDVVHGHSSHHPRPVEVYRGPLVLHGCGDLIDDYEGIRGHDHYRPDLRLLYLARIDTVGGRLVELRMTPMRVRRLRLHHAGPADTAWLARTLTRVSAGLSPPVVVAEDGALAIRPPAGAAR